MLVIGLPLRFYELAAGVTYYRDVVLDDFFDEMSKKSKTETQVTTKESGLMMGLIEDAGVEIVIKNCATCHSTALITQNRLTR